MKLIRTFFSLLMLVSMGAYAQSKSHVELEKMVPCGDCGAWTEHLKESGLDTKVDNVDEVSTLQRRSGMPELLASCLSANVNNYLASVVTTSTCES